VFVGTPAVGRTVPGSTAFFSVDVQSAGNVAIRNVVSYMILPRVGDTFVSGALAAVPRGSAWRPTVTSVTVPAESIVQYSLSTNPCRGEVFSAGGATASAPAACVNDWSTVPPSPLSNVAALRFVTAGPVDPGVTNRFVVEVSTPPTAVGIAYNSIATAAQRADTSAFLQPAETARVGIEAAPVFVTKTVVSGPVDNFDGSQSVQYRIEVRNDGTTPATYALSDDPGFAVASSVVSRSAVNSPPGTIATLPGFDSQATNVIVTGQPIAAGDTHTYLVEMTVRVPVAATSAAADCTLGALEPGTGLLNRASVTVGTAVGVSEACVVPLSGQLQITKTVDAPLANLGDRLTYTVTVANFGAMRAVNLVATDTMPAGLVYVSDTGSGIVSGQVVTWDIPVLQAGQSVSFTLVADIAATFAGTVLDNTVGVAQPLGFAALAVVGPSASNSSLALARTTLRTLGLPGSAALGFTGADVGGGLLAGGVLLGFGALLVAMRRKSVVGSS